MNLFVVHYRQTFEAILEPLIPVKFDTVCTFPGASEDSDFLEYKKLLTSDYCS